MDECEKLSKHGWTLDTLETFMSSRIDALEKQLTAALADQKTRTEAAFASSEKAIVKAENASDARFASVNEFRETLSDQTATFLPRTEYSVQHKALADQIAINTGRLTVLEAQAMGRKEGIGGIGTMVLGALAGAAAITAVGTAVVTLTR